MLLWLCLGCYVYVCHKVFFCYTSEVYEGKYIGIQNPFLIFFD